MVHIDERKVVVTFLKGKKKINHEQRNNQNKNKISKRLKIRFQTLYQFVGQVCW